MAIQKRKMPLLIVVSNWRLLTVPSNFTQCFSDLSQIIAITKAGCKFYFVIKPAETISLFPSLFQKFLILQ